MSRREFSKATKIEAWDRANGICECCEMEILGRAEYDHVCPDALYGKNDLENCQVLCVKCHKQKSKQDVAQISKATRLKEKAAGIRKPKRKMSYRKFNGEPVFK